MGYRDTQRIVVAGDWHGNADWAEQVISMAAEQLNDDNPMASRIILHLGDFGIWPGDAGRDYLWRVSNALKAADMCLWFVDGNHEDFPQLHETVAYNERMFGGSGIGVTEISPGIYWQPRGTRWLWHGRTWLALGGGVSLDRAIRTEGENWWPEEEVSEDQAAEVVGGGRADVLVTHDCPAGVKHTYPPPPVFWDARDLARSDAHQERLQRIVDAVQPSWLMHGHLHRSYQRVCDFGYGPVEVTGLDSDEGDGPNWAMLDVKSMTWELP